jgi:hypothetical protein
VLDIRYWTIEMAGVPAHTHKDVPGSRRGEDEMGSPKPQHPMIRGDSAAARTNTGTIAAEDCASPAYVRRWALAAANQCAAPRYGPTPVAPEAERGFSAGPLFIYRQTSLDL